MTKIFPDSVNVCTGKREWFMSSILVRPPNFSSYSLFCSFNFFHSVLSSLIWDFGCPMTSSTPTSYQLLTIRKPTQLCKYRLIFGLFFLLTSVAESSSVTSLPYCLPEYELTHRELIAYQDCSLLI